MSLLYNEDEFYGFDYDCTPSLKAFELVERRIADKKNIISDLENELDLLKDQALSIYKFNVRYDFIGNENIFIKAQKWLSMIKKGVDSDGNKLDKRKKYPEKTTFEIFQSDLGKLLGIENFHIDDIINMNYSQAYEAEFTYLDHKWALFIPIIKNIQMKAYENNGAYCFKLRLYHYDSPNHLMEVGSTFEEKDLKDILQLGVEKYCTTVKTCKNCKHTPPSKKWPCDDCDAKYHDRWEKKE